MIKEREIERLRAANRRLVEEFRASGVEPARDLDVFASNLVEEEALYGLSEHLRILAARNGLGAVAAYAALNEIIIAYEDYDFGTRALPVQDIRLTRGLTALAEEDSRAAIVALVNRYASDRQGGQGVLVALWGGARKAGLVRDAAADSERIFEVKIWGKGRQVRGDIERGLICLAEDPLAFTTAARKALDDPGTPPRRDWFRLLRDLKHNPTKRRFEALLPRQSQEHDNRIEIYPLVLRQAARRFFGGNLPMTWRGQVAADPRKIKAIAELALDLLKPRTKASGLSRDPALDAYVTTLCEIYQALVGRTVYYNTATAASKSLPEGTRYGPALTFILLGLRLLDPLASEHQARSAIRWYRPSASRDRDGSRRDLGA